MRNTGPIVIATVLGPLGCYSGLGHVDEATAGTESLASDGSGGTTTGGDDDATACAAPQADFVPLRRLTRAEYVATVRDLLGVDASAAADAFGLDESVGGFESNNVSPITRLGVEAYMAAAEDIAAAVDLSSAFPCPAATDASDACVASAIASLALRAYRRPPTAQELAELTALWTTSDHFDACARLTIEALLQSASFLYRPELGDPAHEGELVRLTSWELASRLSYFLWGTMPDQALLDAAAAGALDDPDALATEVTRMLDDERFGDAVRSFHRQWLGLDHLRDGEKDPILFPEYTPSLREAMLEETLGFAERVIVHGDGRFSTLMTHSDPIDDPELAALYGIELPDGGAGTAPADQRGGLLTHASILAAQSNADRQSPILRGKFVLQRLLCTSIPDPPPEAATQAPQVDPNATTRERFEMHAVDPACRGCHVLMDPIGFAFLHYDAIGRWIDDENGQRIDATAQLDGFAGLEAPFDGAIEFSQMLAGSEAPYDCISRQWLRFGLGRPELELDACGIERGREALAAHDGDIRELLFALATSDTFVFTRRQESP